MSSPQGAGGDPGPNQQEPAGRPANRQPEAGSQEPVRLWVTVGLGWFAAVLVVQQLISGLQIRAGGMPPASHVHTGYLLAAVVLLHVFLSTKVLLPRLRKGGE